MLEINVGFDKEVAKVTRAKESRLKDLKAKLRAMQVCTRRVCRACVRSNGWCAPSLKLACAAAGLL
jgi:hypothetical protein